MSKNYKICITIVIVAMSLFAGALRYYSALDNLWMDEIWSWNFAQTMHSPLDVFRVEHTDFKSENTINNHVLNTLYLYYFGDGQWWPRYRIFSIITGVASVALLGVLGFRRNFFAGVASMIFGSLSMPLITYSSEARGYSPAIFFSLAALLVLQKYGKAKTKLLPVFFWLSVILGFLAHYLFFVVFAAFFISSLYQTFKDVGAVGRWKMLVVWYAVPSVFATFFYYFFIKILSNYGGPVVAPGLDRFAHFMVPTLNLPYGNNISAALAFIIFAFVAIWVYEVERPQTLGRGSYLKTLSYIYEKTEGADIMLASDHDFRNPMLIVFYDQFLDQGKNFYYSYSDDKLQDPEWIIAHSAELDYQAPPKIERTGGKIYGLARSFPHSNMFSGWSWFVYRKQ